jgi:predicted MFS family arabinose efflux permease
MLPRTREVRPHSVLASPAAASRIKPHMFRAALRRYRAAYAGLPREAWLLALVLFINRAGTMVIPFLTLYLTSQLGMSEAAAGRLISVYGIGSICGAYLSGRLCEKVGAVRLQTICMLLSAPGYFLIGQWNTWPPIAASLFFLSVANEAVRPANATAITKLTTPEIRTRAFALQRLAVNLGFSFGPAIGGVLATIDFSLLFICDAATALVAGCTLLYFFGMRRVESPNGGADEPPVRVSPLQDRVFVAFLSLSLTTMLVFMQFSTTYPLFLRDHFRLSKPLIGLMFAVNTTIIVAVEMLLIDSVKRWPLIRTIGWGSALACVGFGMLPFGSSMAYAVLAMIVVTIGEMLSFPLAAAFVANRGQQGSESLYLGWYVTVHSVALVVGPAVGAAIYQVNRNALWYAGLGVAVVVAAGYHLLAAQLGDRRCEEVESPKIDTALIPPPAELPLEQLPQHAT